MLRCMTATATSRFHIETGAVEFSDGGMASSGLHDPLSGIDSDGNTPVCPSVCVEWQGVPGQLRNFSPRQSVRSQSCAARRSPARVYLRASGPLRPIRVREPHLAESHEGWAANVEHLTVEMIHTDRKRRQ